MLHGYTQSGSLFSVKTQPLTATLAKTLSQSYNVPEQDIEFIYPDGTVQLQCPDTDPESDNNITDVKPSDVDMRAWWYTLDVVNQYRELEETLAYLAVLVQTKGPFAGVMGFSQGGTLAAMFTAWCESGFVPGRRETMQKMSARCNPLLAGILSQPPQPPLDFAIYCSGYKGTPDYYYGFYEPKIETPTVHVLGTWDTLVPRKDSYELINSCVDAVIVEHQGVHFVPRSQTVLEQISRGIVEFSLRWRGLSFEGRKLAFESEDKATTPPSQREDYDDKVDECGPWVASSPGYMSPSESSTSSGDHSNQSLSRGRRRHPRIVRRYRWSRTGPGY